MLPARFLSVVVTTSRYADEFVVLTDGERDVTEALRGDIADVLQPFGLRISEATTHELHMSEGVRLPGVPHPVAPQTRNGQVRLHLHR